MKLWKKTISILLIHAFLLSSLPVWAAEPAVTTRLANIAAKEISTNPDDVIISKDYGIVKTKFSGKTDKLIIHIQDAHCNYEAQTNIANIVEALVKNNSLQLVSVEGADGVIDTSWFKAFPDADVRKEVANYFMKKGEITGPEFLSITTDYPIKLYGAETREYYIQNLNAFTSSYSLKGETEKYLNNIKAVLNKLQGLIYNDELKTMDSKNKEYESKKTQFNDYVRFLQGEAEKHKINLRQYENLFKLINVLIYEKKIDFNVTDKERSALIDELSKLVAKDVLTELVNRSISFKVGKVSSVDYYNYVKSLAVEKGIDLQEKYPNLYNYTIYNSVYSKINNEKLFGDIKALETAVKEKLFENDDQRTLEKLSRHIDTLLGLINIKLLNDEFDYYKAHEQEFALESFLDFIKAKSVQFGLSYEMESPEPTIADNIAKLDDFYVIAIKRDKAMVDNTLEGMAKFNQKIGVLVTGGFHSEGMAKLLEKQGISYVVVCPNITKDVPTPYIQVLTNQRTSFEDILSGTQVEPATKHGMLAPAHITWAIGLAESNPDEFKAVIAEMSQSGVGDFEARVEDDKRVWIEKNLPWFFEHAQKFAEKQATRPSEDLLMEAYGKMLETAALAHYKADGLDTKIASKEASRVASEIVSDSVFNNVFNAQYGVIFLRGSVERVQGAIANTPNGELVPRVMDGIHADIREAFTTEDISKKAIDKGVVELGEEYVTNNRLAEYLPEGQRDAQIFVIPGLEKHDAYLFAHGGQGGYRSDGTKRQERHIYMSPTKYGAYLELAAKPELKNEFAAHEIVHILKPDLKEDRVREIAPVTKVLEALSAIDTKTNLLAQNTAGGATAPSVRTVRAVEKGGVFSELVSPLEGLSSVVSQAPAIDGDRLAKALKIIDDVIKYPNLDTPTREALKAEIVTIVETLTLQGLSNTNLQKIKVLLAFDSNVGPGQGSVVKAVMDVIKAYMGDAVVGVRGTGEGLLNEIESQIRSNTDEPFTAIVTIAGDNIIESKTGEKLGALPNSKIINVGENPASTYVPIVGLFNLALKVANNDQQGAVDCLNMIAIKEGDNPPPFVVGDLGSLSRGLMRILPKIGRVNPNDIPEAYKAVHAALQSL